MNHKRRCIAPILADARADRPGVASLPGRSIVFALVLALTTLSSADATDCRRHRPPRAERAFWHVEHIGRRRCWVRNQQNDPVEPSPVAAREAAREPPPVAPVEDAFITLGYRRMASEQTITIVPIVRPAPPAPQPDPPEETPPAPPPPNQGMSGITLALVVASCVAMFVASFLPLPRRRV